MPDSNTLRIQIAGARLAAASLAQGGRLDLWSLALTAIALVALLMPGNGTGSVSFMGLALAAGAGLLEKYLALRTAIDARIFRDWADRWDAQSAPAPGGDMEAFDQACRQHLSKACDGPTRNLEQRIRGAMRLLYQQAIVIALQVVLIIATIAWQQATGT